MKKRLIVVSLVGSVMLAGFAQQALSCTKVNGHCEEAVASQADVSAEKNQRLVRDLLAQNVFAIGFVRKDAALNFAQSVGLSSKSIVQKGPNDFKLYLANK